MLLLPGHTDHRYPLKSGLIRLYSGADRDPGMILRYVKSGESFGEESLTGERRRNYAEALTPSVVEVMDLMQLDGAELRRLAAALAAALDNVGRALRRRGVKQSRERMAAELLELSDSDLSRLSCTGESIIPITHEELATAVGSVRETVSKIVGELAVHGAIRIGYAHIIVCDQRLLREVAGE